MLNPIKSLLYRGNIAKLIKNTKGILQASDIDAYPFKQHIIVRKNAKITILKILRIKTPANLEVKDNTKILNFIQSMQRNNVPLAYIIALFPIEHNGENTSIISEILVMTWSTGKIDKLIEAIEKASSNIEKIKVSLNSLFPELEIEELKGKELAKTFLQFFLRDSCEGEQRLPSSQTAFIPIACLPSPSKSISEKHAEFTYTISTYRKLRSKSIFIGWAVRNGEKLYPIHIPLNNLVRHVLIMGMTGSGKSTTAKKIVEQLIRNNVNVLVLDWHNEYGDLIKSLGGLILSPGAENSNGINLFDATYAKSIEEHISLICDIFSETLEFTYPQSYMFLEILIRLYSRKRNPTLSDIVNEIYAFDTDSRLDNEIKQALLRRLLFLAKGQAKRVFESSQEYSIAQILGENTVIELGNFKDQRLRKMYAMMILKLLYDFFTSRGKSSHLRHVTILEEADNIVPRRSLNSPPSIGEKLISELRKFGEGMIIISQFPSMIAPKVLKNTATKICHQIKSYDDIQIIKQILSLTDEQSEMLKHLRKGEAVLDHDEIPYPLLIKVEKVSLSYTPIMVKKSGVSSCFRAFD